MDLRDYRAVIAEEVKALRDADPNWSWRVKSVTKNKVLIRWGYLDYIGQKGDFSVELRIDEMDGDTDVSLIGNLDTKYSWTDNEDRDYLFCWIGDRHWHDASDIGCGLRKVIREIGYQAHSKY